MNKETQTYIENIRHSIEEIKNKKTEPKWQIDFEKYGGRMAYEVIKNMYWERFDRRNSTNFDLKNECLTKDIYDLMVMFRKDLNKQLDIPKKYDKYR